jgi:hypothetical protein
MTCAQLEKPEIKPPKIETESEKFHEKRLATKKIDKRHCSLLLAH